MKTRFTYELIVGIISVVAILCFGKAGNAALALLAIQPFIGGGRNPLTGRNKQQWDEREYHLFYKVGNYTAGLTLVALTVIYYFGHVSINDHLINDNWLTLSAGSFLFAHGLSGLIIFNDN